MDGETLGALCTRHPLALPVLQQLGVVLSDPARPAEACCAEAGVAAATARGAITAAEDAFAGRWRDRSIEALIDEVVRTFHRPFALAVAALQRECEAARDATAHPGWSAVIAELAELQVDLAHHIEIEERVVFPWVRDRAAAATATIRAMQLEHGDAIARLLAIEAIAPAGTGIEATRARAGLQGFERWLCEHIHLESNALFPRALQAERTAR